jgi:hypothetical protein
MLLLSCRDQDPVSPPPAVPEPSAAAAPQDDRPRVVSGQYIVKFRDGVDIPPGLAQALAAQHGLGLRHDYSTVFQGFSARIPEPALPALRDHPLIETIEPNHIAYLDWLGATSAASVTIPTAGLRMRLVADDLALSDGADVDVWPNSGGTEGAATQGQSKRRPTYHAPGATGEFGGHAHVGLNEGGDDDEYLQVSGVGYHGSATLIAVYSQEDATAHNYGLVGLYSSESNRATFATMFDDQADRLGYWDRTSAYRNSTFVTQPGDEHVAVWRVDGSQSVDFQVDGASAGSVALSSDIHDPFGSYVIGNAKPGARNKQFDGQIAELILYDRALADCERDQIVADLGGQYGISVSPPGGGCSPPAPPSGLTASMASASSIDVGWTDNSGDEDGFTVERREGQTGAFQEVGQVGAGVVGYVDTGLPAETEFCYRALSFNADGNSTYSNVDCATTDVVSPPPPPVTVPSSGLRLRLVADELSLSDGAGVDVWSNLGGTEGDATQALVAERPVFHQAGATGQFGGRAHVGFNEGGDDDEYLQVSGVGYHGSATLIAVYSQEDATAHNYILLGLYDSDTDRSSFGTMFDDQADLLGYWDRSSGYRNSTFVTQAGDEHVAVWRVEGAQSVDYQVDGTAAGSVALPGDIHDPFSSYVVGRGIPGLAGRQFDGQIAELILYDRALADCERDQIVTDLGGQYGISVSTTGGTCSPPAPPSGLTASMVSAGSIDVGWTDNSPDEDGFRIERREGQAGAFQVVGEAGADVVSFLDTGLAAQTEYCYRGQSFNADGSSTYSNIDCATTDGLPPAPPPVTVPSTGLRLRLVAEELSLGEGADVDVWPNLGGSESDATQATAGERPVFHQSGDVGKFGGRAFVGFNEGGDDDEYLEVPGVSYHSSATLIAVYSQEDATAHNYVLLGLYDSDIDRGTFATMFNDQGNLLGYWDRTNGYRNSAFVTQPDDDHIAVWRVEASQSVDYQVDGSDQGSVTLPGDIHNPFSRYVVGRAMPTLDGRQFDGQVAELILYDRALPDCERDQIVADLGAQYGISVSTTGGSCTPPAPPSNLTAAMVSATSIDVDWVDNSGNEDGFTVERREGQAGPFQVVAQVGAGVASHQDTGLLAQTEYCYRALSFNGDGSSTYSNVDCATTDVPPPSPPPVTVPQVGLRLRLVANELALADGTDVDAWPNVGGSVGAALQSQADERPSFHSPGMSAQFGGHAHVGFNEGGDDDEYLQVSNVSYHASATLIAVYSQEDATAHNYGIVALLSSQRNRVVFSTMFDDQGDRMGYWDQTNAYRNSTFITQPGDEHVAVWRVEGSQWVDFQVDGVDEGSVALPDDIHSPFKHYQIGTGFAGTNRQFDGQIAELILYDRALADCERDDVVASLGARYGIAVSPPGGGCNAPAAPSALTASAASASSVDVDWTDNSNNEDGFKVERREGQTGTFQEVGQVGPDVVSFVDTGLAAQTEYCYRAWSFNSDGSSTSSNVDCAVTDAPAPPPSPVPAPGLGLRLRLIADELPLADGSDVDLWPNSGGEGDASQSQATERPSFHQPGFSAKFGGRAYVGFNEGADDDEYLQVPGVSHHESATLVAVFSQEDATAHNYVLLGLYANDTDRGTFATMFNDQGDPLGYWDRTNAYRNSTFITQPGDEHIAVWRVEGAQSVDFQIDGADAGSVALPLDIHDPFSSYVIGRAIPGVAGKQFDGQVAELILYDRPLLDCERDDLVTGLGARYGIVVAGGLTGPCVPPDAPTGLSATVVDYRTIDLAWTDHAVNEDGFTVERRLGQSGSFEAVAQVGPDATSYNDGFLFPETEYCYRVSAFNSDGFSAFTNVECGTTPTAPPGACFDTGNHDDLSELWNISRIEADLNPHWQVTQLPGCEITTPVYTMDSGVDSDHPDLNVVEFLNWVAAEPSNTGEDGNGHGTHVAGIIGAIDGNGGVVGVAPGAPIHSFRVCSDDGSCTYDDIIAGVDEVTARKIADPSQPMVVNMSLAGDVNELMDRAVRESVNAGVVFAIGAGNGVIGACIFPWDAQQLSPAGVGDDAINQSGGSDGDTARTNGVMTVTLSTGFDADGNCNFGEPVTIAAPGDAIKSSWLGGTYNTIGGTSMSSPHAAGAAALRLMTDPSATPIEVEQWIMSQLDAWVTDDLPNADGRLNVRQP